jgi:hypothetical protein
MGEKATLAAKGEDERKKRQTKKGSSDEREKGLIYSSAIY